MRWSASSWAAISRARGFERDDQLAVGRRRVNLGAGEARDRPCDAFDLLGIGVHYDPRDVQLFAHRSALARIVTRRSADR